MANLTAYNVAICLVVALGGFTYGFGFAVFVTSIGQPGFYKFFNLDREFILLLNPSSVHRVADLHDSNEYLHRKVCSLTLNEAFSDIC